MAPDAIPHSRPAIRGILRGAAAFLAISAVAVAGAGGEVGEEGQQTLAVGDNGKQLFEMYCANCHGESGRGDGPAAKKLTVRPTDLTRLQEGSSFPYERVFRAIDGRDPVAGHETRTMPIWGLSFQDTGSDANQEARVRDRIERLIEFLKTIQKTGK